MNWIEYVEQVIAYCTLKGIRILTPGIPLEDIYKMYGDNVYFNIYKNENFVSIDLLSVRKRKNKYEVWYKERRRVYNDAEKAYRYFIKLGDLDE